LDPEGAKIIFHKTGVGQWKNIFFMDWITSRKDMDNKLKRLGVPRDVRDRFLQGIPMIINIPYNETDHYKIENPSKQGYDLTITLYAIFNAGVNGPPIKEQEKEYKRQLKAYRIEALNWLKKNGINPTDIKIEWIP